MQTKNRNVQFAGPQLIVHINIHDFSTAATNQRTCYCCWCCGPMWRHDRISHA